MVLLSYSPPDHADQARVTQLGQSPHVRHGLWNPGRDRDDASNVGFDTGQDLGHIQPTPHHLQIIHHANLWQDNADWRGPDNGGEILKQLAGLEVVLLEYRPDFLSYRSIKNCTSICLATGLCSGKSEYSRSMAKSSASSSAALASLRSLSAGTKSIDRVDYLNTGMKISCF